MSYPFATKLLSELEQEPCKPLIIRPTNMPYESSQVLGRELVVPYTNPIVQIRPVIVGINPATPGMILGEQLSESESRILLPESVIRGLVYHRLQQIKHELGIKGDAFDPFSAAYEEIVEELMQAPEELLDSDETYQFEKMLALPKHLIKQNIYYNQINGNIEYKNKDYITNELPISIYKNNQELIDNILNNELFPKNYNDSSKKYLNNEYFQNLNQTNNPR